MHLTNVLFRHNLYRQIKRVWKVKGKMPVAPLQVPPELKEMGVKIYNALDVAKGIEDSKSDESEADIQIASDEKYFVFDNKTKITSGEEQALALTKTLAYHGLTPVVSSLLGKETLPDQDSLVKNCILGALVHDGHLHKLPKVIDITQPGKRLKRVFGPRQKRRTCNMMQKLALLSGIACAKYPDSLYRTRDIDAFTELVVERGGQTVVFQIRADILLSSEKPLEPVASPEDVVNTENVELASIHPILPTLDLNVFETNPLMRPTYNIAECEQRKKLHVHTLHVVQQSFGYWKPEQKVARAIATAFTFAAEQARLLYGPDVKILPVPVTVQCIYSDAQVMGFLTYQLNTLDLRDDSGIKNQVWIEDPLNFYGTVDELKGITDYNPEVFPKMVAFYLNGVHPLSL